VKGSERAINFTIEIDLIIIAGIIVAGIQSATVNVKAAAALPPALV
jgi:hypothetical protein